ncbi:MerR family transcriptional regulator [uncultured Amnibacterium sp.]|uniref:MerR family transcriptional regulator n=1 Tax=uncultured Amnibacterium sp. TaxID=1631851 RepID=UPI0035CBDB5D
MYSIGRFASIGRVTVRMLRHWDEIGLLVPAHVDPETGYRSYAPAQLPDVDEIVRLRDLGVGLVDIGRIRRSGLDEPASRRSLEAARDALRDSIETESRRLARFDAYLRGAEGDPAMTDAPEIEFRLVPAQRVATITRRAAGFGSHNIGPVVGPIFPEVEAALSAAGIPFGPAVAIYSADESGDGSGVLVTAGFQLEGDAEAVPGLDVHVLPGLEQAAILTHRGSMETIDASWMALIDAVRARGAVLADAGREIYLTPGDVPQERWVTRLVQPIA